MKLTVGLYAVYLLLVSLNGNAPAFFVEFEKDAPGFLPWLVAAAVIGALYNVKETHQFAAAFLALVAIGFVVKNWQALMAQWNVVLNTSGINQTVQQLNLTPVPGQPGIYTYGGAA